MLGGMQQATRIRQVLLSLAAAAALVLTAVPGGAFASTATPTQPIVLDPHLPVHPYLQYGAQAEPNRQVRVIVRFKRDALMQFLSSYSAYSASKIKDLNLIHATVLQLPMRAVLALGRSPFIEYISYDGPVKHKAIDATALKSAYEQSINAPNVWNSLTTPATGAGVTVAVVDTGVNAQLPDLTQSAGVICTQVASFPTCNDDNGHGSHVIGILKGRDVQGRYVGVAPDSRVISVKIGDANGMGTESDMVNALQWVYDNRATYNIKVVNISYAAALPQSYATSPVDAAVEQLWLNGVTVVAAAGNTGTASDATWYAPGNDPFVITVGALDDNGTPSQLDDSLAVFSSRGNTQDGFYKPEIVAPGRHIVSTLSSMSSTLATQRPTAIVDGSYLQLSGTSMSVPVVSGVAALLLEKNPNLTPNQIKWVLKNSAVAYPGMADTAARVDADAAMRLALGGSLGLANQGFVPSANIDPTSGTIVGSTSYWNESYWNESYWNESTTLPDHTYWE
jgi:serine protease AprX